MLRQSLTESTKLAKEGHLSQAIEAIQREIENTGPSYALFSNLAALFIQLGEYQKAITCCQEAITADPYSHVAYYNRFLCYFSEGKMHEARKQLRKALSCLYMTRGYEEDNVKFLNKAISYCEQNARAYLIRGKLNETRNNNKLAENDYSAAVEYDPKLAEIYQQRALFFRRVNRKEQFESDLSTYMKLKHRMNRPIPELVDNEVQPSEEAENKVKLEEEVRQFQGLLLKTSIRPDLTQSVDRGDTMSKLPLSSMQSRIERRDDEELLLSDRQVEGSAQTITIKKEEIQFRKRPVDQKMEKNFRQIFQDQSSRDLDDKIDMLEREIQREGGKISINKGEQEELDVSDPSNFLTQEIEKAIEEIAKLGSGDLADVKSVRSAASQGSLGSKRSEAKELTLQEFYQFKKIQVEIVSLQDIQSYNRKENCKIQLRYGDRIWQTSMKRCEWRQTLSFTVSEGVAEVEVKVIEKGGIFSSDSEMGEGTINLLQSGNIKCIIGNKEKKVAILYFKIKLV